jgi:hypothetical protein
MRASTRAVLLGSALLLAGRLLAAAELRPFEASFTVNWHGMNAGTSSLSLQQRSADTWLYTSSSVPRGLFRAFLPDEITQRSELRIVGDQVQPQHYAADDGTASKKRDLDLHFDWERQRVTGVAAEQTVDAPLEAGVQDDLSVQIALMVALSAGRVPADFKTFNERGVREYQYRREGAEKIQTALGAIDTIIFSSGRPGSSRVTRYWCAPSLGYLPLRAQQKRGEQIEWTMDIRRLQRD